MCIIFEVNEKEETTKKTTERRFDMNGGYESLIWVRGNDGHEYACSLEDVKNPEKLSEEERQKCLDVNVLIGTERW